MPLKQSIIVLLHVYKKLMRYLWFGRSIQKRFMFLMPPRHKYMLSLRTYNIYKNITKTWRYEYTLKALVSICFIVWVLFVDVIIKPYLDSIFRCDLNKRGFSILIQAFIRNGPVWSPYISLHCLNNTYTLFALRQTNPLLSPNGLLQLSHHPL